MTKKKLKKYSEVDKFPNVVHQEFEKRVSDFLRNSTYTVLELACGKGEYSLEIARRNPTYKVLGIDVKGDRIWHGAKIAIEEELNNLLFLRTQVNDVAEIFPENSIDEIWITFSDPFPKDRDAKRRLTSSRFLEKYKKVLKHKNKIHLKTDDDNLFEFSIQTAQEFGAKDIFTIEDIWNSDIKENDIKLVKTYYENKHLREGKRIHYLEFSL